MEKPLFLFPIVLLISFWVNGQNAYLSDKNLNFLVNKKFSGLVTGTSSSTLVSNYASFDPVAGSFTFKGSLPMQRDTDKAAFSFLTFRIEGDLISNSYAALFQNSALNTNALIDAQYHFRLNRSFKRENHLSTDEAELELKRQMLLSNATFKLSKAQNIISSLTEDRDLTQIKLRLVTTDLNRKRDSIACLQNHLAFEVHNNNEENIKTLSDSLTSLLKRANDAIEDSALKRRKIDSLNYLITKPSDAILIESNKITDEYQQKLRALNDSATLTGLRFGWFTIISGASKKKYYTFDAGAPFETQIQKKELSAFKVGLAWNYYSEKSFPKRIFFMNLGVVRYRDNNTALLSTQDVTEEKVVINSGGDTTRKVSKTYKAYTDSIAEFQVWDFFANFYFLRSLKNSAFHVFPSFDVYDKGKSLLNIGAGYLISFKNQKKDNPIINAEGYVQFNDLFNHLEGKAPFWNRNEIGVRFTIPFYFFN